MAESTGWGGEFHLHNGIALTELEKVEEIGFPEDTADELETTTLKSQGRRKEFMAGMIDGGSFTVPIIHVAGSATDLLCRAAKNAGDVRPWRTGVPTDDGTIVEFFDGTGFVSGYSIAPLRPNEVQKATLTIRVSGAVTITPAS